MTKPKIFVNYRWRDSKASAGRLADSLKGSFRQVFFDTSHIDGGEDYYEASLAAVKDCDVLLAVIGENWLDPRLHNPKDVVRREIETAFEEGKQVIPVLMEEEARQPISKDLPVSLSALSHRKAVRLHHASWEQDVDGLVKKLRAYGQERKAAFFLPFQLRRLAVWTLLLLLPLSLNGVSPSHHAFRRLPQPSVLQWVMSGEWYDDHRILLVDAQKKKTFLCSSATGQLVEFDLGLSKPEGVHAVQDGYLVENGEGEMFRVPRSLRRPNKAPVQVTVAEGEEGLASLVQWVPVGNEILGFGDTCEYPEHCKRSFVRLSLGSPDSFDILHSMSLDHPRRILYYFGYPFVAEAGGMGYFLAMDGRPRICEMPPRHEKSAKPRCLEKIPSDLLRPAELPAISGKKNVDKLYRALVLSTSTAGLYGQGDALYVLNRRPSREAGLTDWTVSRIHRRSGEILYTKDLLTHAPHLTLIPGPRYWALVEKGEVKDFGKQEVLSVLFVPSSYFERQQ